jgi:hypothetical protein
MRVVYTIVVCAALLAPAGQAEAAYDYDFSTLYTYGQALEGTVVDSVVALTSETTGLKYETGYGGGLVGNEAATSDIFMGFAGKLSTLSVTAGDGQRDPDAFRLNLYDGTTSLGSVDAPIFDGAAEPEWYTLTVDVAALLPGANVNYVAFDPGNAGDLPGLSNADGGVALTMLSFEFCDDPDPPDLTLPGPGTLVLCALGVPLLTWLRARRMF